MNEKYFYRVYCNERCKHITEVEEFYNEIKSSKSCSDSTMEFLQQYN